jgi:hypothetical protein
VKFDGAGLLGDLIASAAKETSKSAPFAKDAKDAAHSHPQL